MTTVRLIARLDIKGEHLIKGINLEGVRKIGDPHAFASRYYREGIDEIVYLDAVASLYGRNSLLDIVRRTAEKIFIPITVGGGLRSADDAQAALRAGADKVAINTEATRRPDLIAEMAQRFGSQAVVLSIQAKRQPGGGWEALRDLGREHTGLDAVEWATRGESLGAGEILVTSVDQEGTGQGFDVELVRAVSRAVSIPVIASGGMGTIEHLEEVVREGEASAVAMAQVVHYGRLTVPLIRAEARARGLQVRSHD